MPSWSWLSDPMPIVPGIAVRNDKGEFVLVNGNQIVMIFLNYLMTRNKELGLLKGNEYIVKTIVTTETFLSRRSPSRTDSKCTIAIQASNGLLLLFVRTKAKPAI